MSSKSLDHKDTARVQGATVLGPGDFPIGSMQSRAAARLRLQKIGEAGKGSSECICFPEDERPFSGLQRRGTWPKECNAHHTESVSPPGFISLWPRGVGRMK
jgi:hypothetical protein